MQALTALVNVMPGQIVSRTLAQNKAVSITVFAFDKGTEISTHESTGDAMVQVLEGTGCFTVDGKEYLVHPGEVLVMPANVPHAVSAPEAFKWVLTVVSRKDSRSNGGFADTSPDAAGQCHRLGAHLHDSSADGDDARSDSRWIAPLG